MLFTICLLGTLIDCLTGRGIYWVIDLFISYWLIDSDFLNSLSWESVINRVRSLQFTLPVRTSFQEYGNWWSFNTDCLEHRLDHVKSIYGMNGARNVPTITKKLWIMRSPCILDERSSIVLAPILPELAQLSMLYKSKIAHLTWPGMLYQLIQWWYLSNSWHRVFHTKKDNKYSAYCRFHTTCEVCNLRPMHRIPTLAFRSQHRHAHQSIKKKRKTELEWAGRVYIRN